MNTNQYQRVAYQLSIKHFRASKYVEYMTVLAAVHDLNDERSTCLSYVVFEQSAGCFLASGLTTLINEMLCVRHSPFLQLGTEENICVIPVP